MVAQYEAEKVKYQKLMDKVPEEVSLNNILDKNIKFSLAGEGKGKGREAPEESNCVGAKRCGGTKGLILVVFYLPTKIEISLPWITVYSNLPGHAGKLGKTQKTPIWLHALLERSAS